MGQVAHLEAQVIKQDAVAKWLHEHRFGCVARYGTDEVSREAYDRQAHTMDAKSLLETLATRKK